MSQLEITSSRSLLHRKLQLRCRSDPKGGPQTRRHPLGQMDRVAFHLKHDTVRVTPVVPTLHVQRTIIDKRLHKTVRAYFEAVAELNKLSKVQCAIMHTLEVRGVKKPQERDRTSMKTNKSRRLRNILIAFTILGSCSCGESRNCFESGREARMKVRKSLTLQQHRHPCPHKTEYGSGGIPDLRTVTATLNSYSTWHPCSSTHTSGASQSP